VGNVSYGRLPGKAQSTGVRLLGRFNSVPSLLLRVSRDLEFSFSAQYREGDTLTNGDSPY